MDPIIFQSDLDASPEEVWVCWTTPKGVKSFFAPNCRIELCPGGSYEILFDTAAPEGQQGTEGEHILALEKPNFLSFTWNAPPTIPEIRKQHTWVEIRIAGRSGGSVLSLTNGGYGDGPDWLKARDYFVRAWGDVVLPRLQRSLVEGPIDWTAV